jgi:hypothetical protein
MNMKMNRNQISAMNDTISKETLAGQVNELEATKW